MDEKHSPSSPPPPAAAAAEPSAPPKAIADVPKASAKPPRPNLRKIYALPAPIRTFPLPTFNPSNPLSLLHLAYAWAKQLISARHEPSAIHEGTWYPDLGTVVIRDPASMRALWEQGFYGKGHLSRSEPNWFKGEKVRRGLLEDHVSEVYTAKRREDRKMMKWERARVELEAIRQTRLEEAKKAQEEAYADALVNSKELGGREDSTKGVSSPPVGPLELLALPNSLAAPEQFAEAAVNGVDDGISVPPVGPMQLLALPNSTAACKQPAEIAVNGVDDRESVPPVGPLELLALPNSAVNTQQAGDAAVNGVEGNSVSPVGPMQLLALPNSVACSKEPAGAVVNGVELDETTPDGISLSPTGPVAAHTAESPSPETSSAHTNGIAADPLQLEAISEKDMQALKAQKSVRFSTEVRSTTVDLTNPPSPALAAANGKPVNGQPRVATLEISSKDSALRHSWTSPDAADLVDKEHLQLTREEAFFLAFALGTLTVKTASQSPISTRSLLDLFRAYSYNPPSQTLSPDDTFLTQYVTYHHFRSLGFTPRPGIKFAVDWLLYLRGPVFDHAEYGVVVVPSYSHPYWKSDAGAAKKRNGGGGELSWSWLHGASRTLSHAVKTIVIAYVDVPPPAMFEEALGRGGVVDVLGLYSVREVIIKRFSPNRNRNS